MLMLVRRAALVTLLYRRYSVLAAHVQLRCRDMLEAAIITPLSLSNDSVS